MAISIEDKVLTNMSQEKINQIINVAAEEIAKYVDVCNEGGQLVMKVKDGVKLKEVDIFLGNNYYISSDKDFCNPVGMIEKKAFIDIDQESKVATKCTIPTSVKFSNRNKDHCAFGVQLGQPHSAIICRNNGGDLLGISYQDFCNVVREKINNMQANANSIQDDNNDMSQKTNDEILKDLMDTTGETKKKKKKKNKKGKVDKIEEPKEDQKDIVKQEDQKVDEKQVETVKQSKVVQRRPNYVKKTNISEKKRDYYNHYLQEAKDYYTYNGEKSLKNYYNWPKTPLNMNAEKFIPQRLKQNSK